MATPILDEISNMPQGQEELMQHLYDRGYATPPPPPPPPAPLVPDATVASMTPPDRYAGARQQNFTSPINDEGAGGAPDLGGAGPSPAGIGAGPTPAAGGLNFAPMSPVNPARGTPLSAAGPAPSGMAASAGMRPLRPAAPPSGLPPWASGSHPAGPWAAGATPPAAGPGAAAAPVPGAELNPPELAGMEAVPSGGATPAIPAAMTKPSMEMTKKEAGQSKREIGKLQYEAERPQITAAYNTKEYWDQVGAQKDFDLKHPLGSDVSRMPGLKGKILHGLATAGELAGQAIRPDLVQAIPGTRLNLGMGEETALEEGGKAEARELAEKTEATREKHEENVEDVNEQRMKNAQDKLDNEMQKITNVRERDLRKQGLKLNPLDPQGPPISLTRDEMSPLEQSVLDFKNASAGAADAKAALDQIKADPNSPQNQATFRRIQVMAQNAATNAGKLGLDTKKYLADYFGMDENFQPLAGVQVTPEGRPVGPKIAGSTQKALKDFNRDYIKPAEDAQRSYELFQDSYAMHKAGKDVTGAESMQALSAHLQTTFGTVKGARITKDMIEHHLHARNVTDDMEVAINKLMNGGVLSDNQWAAFDHLINNSRGLLWKTAVKEGKRASLPINFLPADLERTLNPKAAGAAAPTATAPAAAKPPRPPSPGMEWRRSNKTGAFKEFPKSS